MSPTPRDLPEPDQYGAAEPASGPRLSRREVLAGTSLLAAAAALGVDLSGCTKPSRSYRVLTDHEAAVVVEATARLIPGPADDPAEAGHPGAREAGVVHYIDGMLGALHRSPALVYAGGPFPQRDPEGSGTTSFVKLPGTVRAHWQRKLEELTRQYKAGIRRLDQLAGGDFAKASPQRRDTALMKEEEFRKILFQHAIEGCYALPLYLGNAGGGSWKEIRFPGGRWGFAPDEVSRSDGRDSLAREGVVAKVLDLLEQTSPASTAKPAISTPTDRTHP